MLLKDNDRPEPVPSGVRELALFLTPDPGAEAREVEAAIKGMLLLLEEFCSLTDMAFIKMVGCHAAFLEAHVPQAKRDCGAFPQALCRWLGSQVLSSCRNKPAAAAVAFELPTLYRTEDHFPEDTQESQCHNP